MKSYRVFWSLAAELRLLRIHAYYADRAGIRVANKLMREVVNATVRLGRQPLIGQVEPLLEGMQTEYRYLVTGNYKMIYTVDDDLVEVRVADVFDCRQDPGSMLKER